METHFTHSDFGIAKRDYTDILQEVEQWIVFFRFR